MFSTNPRPAPARPRFVPNLEALDARITPDVATVSDVYHATKGQVLVVDKAHGVLANDFSTQDPNAVLVANNPTPLLIDLATGAQLANPLPANTLQVNPDGSFILRVPTNLPSAAILIGFLYTATNAFDPNELPGVGQVSVYLNTPSTPRFAVGADAGGKPVVNVFEVGTGRLVQSIQAYEDTFTGGVRVAEADLTGDGVADVITAPGPGGGPRVKVFDGQTGRVVFDVFVFSPTFTGGAYVAAGDFNEDGFTDLIVGAGAGGGPRVIVYNGQIFIPQLPAVDNPFFAGPVLDTLTTIVDGDILADFFAYEPTFTGGVRVAAGHLSDTVRDQIVTAPGPGGGPVIKVWDYDQIVGLPAIFPFPTPLSISNIRRQRYQITQFGRNANGSAAPELTFLAGAGDVRSGINVAVGDVNGDGRGEIITGTASGQAVVSVFSSVNGGLLNQFGVPFEPVPVISQETDLSLFGASRPPSGTIVGPTQIPNALIPTGPGVPYGGAAVGFPRFADGGVTVTTRDWDGDGKAEIITGSGPGNTSRVRVFKPDGTEIASFTAFTPDLLTGVNVG